MANTTAQRYVKQDNVISPVHFDIPKVIQVKRKGRYPKSITSMWKVRMERSCAKYMAEKDRSQGVSDSVEAWKARERGWFSRNKWQRVEFIAGFMSGMTGLDESQMLPVISKMIEGIEMLMKEKQQGYPPLQLVR